MSDQPQSESKALVISDDMKSLKRSNARLFDKAVKNQWPISEEVRAFILQQAVEGSKSPIPRQKLAWTRLLVTMNGQNVDMDKTLINIEQRKEEMPPKQTFDFSQLSDDQRRMLLEIKRAMEGQRLLEQEAARPVIDAEVEEERPAD